MAEVLITLDDRRGGSPEQVVLELRPGASLGFEDRGGLAPADVQDVSERSTQAQISQTANKD